VGTSIVSVLVPSQAEIEERKGAADKSTIFNSNTVYGKVVDEAGNPISGATVRIGIADRPGHRNVVTPYSDDVQQPSKDRPIVLVLRKQT
jgi:protocatechuate 3,4-dioxygenase beta subunit